MKNENRTEQPREDIQMQRTRKNPASDLEQEHLSLPSLLRNLAAPSARRWRQRTRAAKTLSELDLTPAQTYDLVDALLDVVENQLPGDTRDAQEKACFVWMACAFPLALMFFGSLGLALGQEEGWEWAGGLCGLLGTAFVIGPPILLSLSLDVQDWCINRVRTAAVEALERLRVPQAVGPLAAALFDSNRGIQKAAEKALLATLPMLETSHYGTLESQAVPRLCAALRHNNETLRLELLEALGKVGDSRALPTIARLEKWGWTARVRETAARIRPILEERKREESNARMLLRASLTPEIDAALLVRPAEGTDPPELLLRPLSADVSPETQNLLRSAE